MSHKKLFLSFSLICLITIVSVTGYFIWKNHSEKKAAIDRLNYIEELIDQRNYDAAYKMLSINRPKNMSVEFNDNWRTKELDLAVKLYQLPKVQIISNNRPDLINKNEDASLLNAKMFIHQDNVEEYAKLRNNWKGREKFPDRWLALDIDHLIINRKREAAIKLLEESADIVNENAMAEE